MNTLKNTIQLIGNLGADPEFKTFDSGKSRVSFSLATSESYKKADGEFTETTQWHNIIAWGNTAEYLNKSLKKGHQVLIHGKLTYRSYDDKENNKRYITEVIANSFLKLTKEPVAI